MTNSLEYAADASRLIEAESSYNATYQEAFVVSYFDVFIRKLDDKGVTRRRGFVEYEGLSVYISGAVPLAAIGVSIRSEAVDGMSSGWSELVSKHVDTLPSGDWAQEIELVKRILTQHGYRLMSQEEACLPIWNDIELNCPHCERTYFGAIFCFDY